MWQVLAAAAVAGSGLVARRLLGTNATEPIIIPQQNDEKFNHHPELPPDFENPSQSHYSNFSNEDDYNDTGDQQGFTLGDESIFRFSSASRSSGGVEVRMGSKNLRKKLGFGSRRIREKVEGFKNNSGVQVKKKYSYVRGREEGLAVMDQRNTGKRFSVCLKKPRTSKNASSKCESCASKDNSIFSWGLGFGIMYMMSAGKEKINRLNMAMDETTRVVQELKTELCKRKLDGPHARSSIAEAETKPREGKHAQKVLTKSSSDGVNAEVSFVSLPDEGESASSVLTEELQPGVMKMYQLESELESELQKLHLCNTESPVPDDRREDAHETEIPDKGYHRQDGQDTNSCQFGGVLPSELDQKLCHLLIGQQESQIVELESELHRTNSKLYEKEAELQALKNCVRRLSEFSLSSILDEEVEAQLGEEHAGDEDHVKKGPHSHRSIIGIKRAMDFEK